MKRQPTEWEKIFANGAVYKGLIPKVYQQLIQPSIKNKNMNTPSRKWAEDLKTFLQRRHTDGQQALEKVISITNYFKNVNQNYLTQVRMAIFENSTVIKCWRGCGEKGTLRHSRWDHMGITAEAWIDGSLYQLALDRRRPAQHGSVSGDLFKLLSPPGEFSLWMLFVSLSLDSLKCQFLCIHRWCFYIYVSS